MQIDYPIIRPLWGSPSMVTCVQTIKTVLDRVSTAPRGIQRSMQTQPSRDSMLDRQREIRDVLKNVERMRLLSRKTAQLQ